MIESILSFFALWGLGFWLLAGLSSVVFIVAAEKDILPLSIVTTIILGIVYYAPLKLILGNPIVLAIVFVSWVVIGIIWSIIRWTCFLNKIVDKFNNDQMLEYEFDKATQLKNNKSRIINWIIYWPWSMIWNVVGDFFQSIYRAMEGVYKRILENALKKVDVKKLDVKKKGNRDED